jgi:hypothetical protein
MRCGIFGILLAFLCACHSESHKAGQPHAITLTAGDLTATFVDNSAMPPRHRAGYNGIASLQHNHLADSIFVPLYAGFNLEHIFSGDSLIDTFEPRRHPMTLSLIDKNTVELHQSPTPVSHFESWTRFTLCPSHYVDVEFRCQAHPGTFFSHGYIGLFWASYIFAPEDKHIYFWGYSAADPTPRWISAHSEAHGSKSSHRSAHDSRELYFAENFSKQFLARDLSDYRFLKPVYYGRYRDMVFIYMFDNDRDIRFSQSPTGGGPQNPAWDFHFIIEPFRYDTTYSFKSRIVYKPFVSEQDVIDEFEKWANQSKW